jgi:hypothetical protein
MTTKISKKDPVPDSAGSVINWPMDPVIQDYVSKDPGPQRQKQCRRGPSYYTDSAILV